jgi:hypothetical protein
LDIVGWRKPFCLFRVQTLALFPIDDLTLSACL